MDELPCSRRSACDAAAVDSGDGIATFHKRTQAFGRSVLASPLPAERPVAKEISLALDTTYIRSNQPERGRQWEILVGAAESEAGVRRYFGVPIRDRAASLEVTHRALIGVGRSPTTKCTAFTDGDSQMRQLAAHVGIGSRPILD